MMMTTISGHSASADDLSFVRKFEQGLIAPERFDHRAHVRLAYVSLCASDVDQAHARIRESLKRYLAHIGAPPDKYHETLTRAWILAVQHFMDRTGSCGSAEELIARNPELLDSRIMLTHYSAEVLFSSEARGRFVEPDIQSIPPGDN